MTLRFAKPSLWRVLWSIIAVAVVSCVITGIALSIGFIVGYDGPEPVSKGEYVRLVITCLTFWGPMYLLIAWWATIPAIIGLGALAACVRRARAADQGSERPAAEETSESG